MKMKKWIASLLAVSCLLATTVSAKTLGHSKDYDFINTASEGYCAVMDDGKWGFIDIHGTEIVAPYYDTAQFFFDGMMEVELGGKYGFVNTAGTLVIPTIYEDVHGFSQGYAGFQQNGLYGFLDKQGNVVLPNIYTNVSIFNNDLAAVLVGTQWGYINKTGTMVIAPAYEAAGTFCNGFAVVEKYNKLGVIDTAGNLIIDYLYKTAEDAQAAAAKWALSQGSTEIPEPNVASPTAAYIFVDGTETTFDAYTIDDNNYIKLRDVAEILSGTEAQFAVEWDEEKQAINLETGKAYTPVGGEMTPGDGTAKAYAPNTSAIYQNGEAVELTAYTISGNNYFKLRDLGEALGFNVSWNEEKGTILVNSNQPYTAD